MLDLVEKSTLAEGEIISFFICSQCSLHRICHYFYLFVLVIATQLLKRPAHRRSYTQHGRAFLVNGCRVGGHPSSGAPKMCILWLTWKGGCAVRALSTLFRALAVNSILYKAIFVQISELAQYGLWKKLRATPYVI